MLAFIRPFLESSTASVRKLELARIHISTDKAVPFNRRRLPVWSAVLA